MPIATQVAKPVTNLQNVPDLMVRLIDISDDSVQGIRKTVEIPPRVSVYDVLGALTGYTAAQYNKLFSRLTQQYPEI